jgi:type I restriction enzyme M protein
LVALYSVEATAKKAAKDYAAKLDELNLAQYGKLTTEEIQSLVISDKWGAQIARGVEAELSALIQNLVERLHLLAERYAETLEAVDDELSALESKVVRHLAEMGIK